VSQGESADTPVQNIVPTIQDFPDDGTCGAITAATTIHRPESLGWSGQYSGQEYQHFLLVCGHGGSTFVNILLALLTETLIISPNDFWLRVL